MPDPSPTELELTPDLLDYARAKGIEIAKGFRNPRSTPRTRAARPASPDRQAAQVGPGPGASPTTLIYTIVQRAVIKFVEREARDVRQFRTLRESLRNPRRRPLRAFIRILLERRSPAAAPSACRSRSGPRRTCSTTSTTKTAARCAGRSWSAMGTSARPRDGSTRRRARSGTG